MKISYWLIPAQPQLDQFTLVIKELAQKFNAPVFTPHLTVYSGKAATAQTAPAALRRVAEDFTAFRLRTIGISFSNEFTKTLFIDFAPDETLTRLANSLKQDSANPAAYELKPHLSLIYSELPERVKSELAVTLELVPCVAFDSLQAVASGEKTRTREDVESWRVIAEVSLRR